MKPEKFSLRSISAYTDIRNQQSDIYFDPYRPQYVLKRFHRNTPEAYQEAAIHCFASRLTVGVVSCYGVSLENGQLGLVLEACQKENIARICDSLKDQGKWSEVDLLRIVVSMMRTVQQLHEECIVHGNLKLENWLLSQQKCLRLTDFGSARLVPRPWTPQDSYSFGQDQLQLGRNLYEMAFFEPCRYEEHVPFDLMKARIRMKFAHSEYSEKLVELIYHLIAHDWPLEKCIAETRG